MAKKCEKCGAVMPEEANICLNCFTVCEQAGAVVEADGKIGALDKAKAFFKGINKKKATAIIAAALCVAVVVPVSVAYGTGNLGNNITSEKSVIDSKAKVETKETKDDGSVVITYDDGTVSTENTDGTVITEKADGTVITQKADGTVVTKETDGTVVTTKTDGSVVTEKTDGTVVTAKTDGTVITAKADGTVITENPDGTTEVTQVPTTTTTQPTTETTTKAEATTTATTSSNADDYEIEYDNFEFYYNSNNILIISKYTGNSKVVVVPSVLDGNDVKSIAANTFADNSTVEKIIIQDSDTKEILSISSGAFTNCSALKEIVLPKKRNVQSTSGMAANCQKLMSIDTNSNSYWKFENSALYRSNGNGGYTLIYYCEGNTANEYHLPLNHSVNYSSVFKYSTNLKNIYLNEKTTVNINWYFSDYLEAVYIDDANTGYYDIDGVVFQTSNNRLVYYPNMKTDTEYTIPDGAYVNFLTGNYKNSFSNGYLKTLTIPKNVTFLERNLEALCKSTKIEAIRVENGNAHLEYIQQNFTGEVIVY